MSCCYFTKKPDENATLARVGFSGLDWIFLSSFIIWATTVMASAETNICKNQDP